MFNKLLKILLFTLGLFLISNTSLAFDSKTDCSGVTVNITNETIQEDIIDTINNLGSNHIKNDKYVVCFESEGGNAISIKEEPLSIDGKDKPQLIHGLFLTPHIGFTKYTGTILKITGSNITLHNLKIEEAKKAIEIGKAENIKLINADISGENGVLIQTSNAVDIEKSNISTDKIGVLIGRSSRDISINSTTITSDEAVIVDHSNAIFTDTLTLNAAKTGLSISNADTVDLKGLTVVKVFGGAEDSKAVYVKDSKNIEPEKIEISGFKYGFYIEGDSQVSVGNAKFTNVEAQNAIYWVDRENVPEVDVETVGKSVDESGEAATRIVGLSPTIIKSCVGSVDIYANTMDDLKTDYIFIGNAVMQNLSDELCINRGDEEINDNEMCKTSDDCYCYDPGTCLFVFERAKISLKKHVVFSYVGSNKVNNSFTQSKMVNDMRNIVATVELIAESGGPTGAGFADPTDGGDVVDNSPVDVDPDDSGDVDAPGDGEGLGPSGEFVGVTEGGGGGGGLSSMGGGSSPLKAGCSLNRNAECNFAYLIILLLMAVGVLGVRRFICRKINPSTGSG